MSLFNTNPMPGFLIAGTLSLAGGTAFAQPKPEPHPEGRAGLATLCIEKRSYVDTQTKQIVTPSIYLDEMPKEGIDTLYIPGGPVAQKWEAFLNPTDESVKKWLEDTGIPDQGKVAKELMEKIDKDKNGFVTPKEFEEGSKGHELKPLQILAYLAGIRCVSLYLTEGALNVVDLDAFPEVAELRTNLETANTHLSEATSALTEANGALEKKNAAHAALAAKLKDAESEKKKWMWATYGAGALFGLMLVGGLGRSFLSYRRKKQEEGKKPDAAKPADAGKAVMPPPLPKTAATAATPSPATAATQATPPAPATAGDSLFDADIDEALAKAAQTPPTDAGTP